jgi:UDP-N-acetylmuramoyl-tripeptide--D-alanyl-D-alanine ligase
VAVLGSMAELGRESSQQHAEVVMRARTVGVEEIHPVGTEMCRAMGVAEEPTEDLGELGNRLAESLRAGDAVLFKGSRSVGLERAVDALLESLGFEGDEH